MTVSIVDFDSVVVLEDGKVAETGNPRALLKVEHSVFRSLAGMQGIRAAYS